MIEGKIRIGAARGGGVKMMTGIDGRNGTRVGDGIETGMATTAIVIQTNEIARETDARGAVTGEIEHPCVKVNAHPHCIECTYASSSHKRC